MRVPFSSRGVLTDSRPYQNFQTSISVKMTTTTSLASLHNPTAFGTFSVPTLSKALPIHHQLPPSPSRLNAHEDSSRSSSLSAAYSNTLYPLGTVFSDRQPSFSGLHNFSSNPDMSLPLLIVLDFDGTITQDDTLDTLVRFAAHYAVIRDNESHRHNSLSGARLVDNGETGGYTRCLRDSDPFSHCHQHGSQGIAARTHPGGMRGLALEQSSTSLGTDCLGDLNSDDANTVRKPGTGHRPGEGVGTKGGYVSASGRSEDAKDSSKPGRPTLESRPRVAPSQTGTACGQTNTELSGRNLKASETPQASVPSVSAASLLEDWRVSVIEPYLQDLEKFETNYRPYKKDRSTWKEEEEYLESLRPVEEKSLERIEAMPIFKGFTGSDFRRFGREAVHGPTGYPSNSMPSSSPPSNLNPPSGQNPLPCLDSPASCIGPLQDELTFIKLRNGFSKFLGEESLERGEWTLGLVSVNWSLEFIEGILGLEDSQVGANQDNTTRKVCKLQRNKTHTDSKLDIDEVEGRHAILANHITPVPAINGPPGWKKPLTTARDKAEAFSELRKHAGLTGSVVYMGDSKTDLLCLRDADLGIVLADDPDQSSLLATLQRLGNYVPHVSEITCTKTHYAWARDFEEIVESKILSRLDGKTE